LIGHKHGRHIHALKRELSRLFPEAGCKTSTRSLKRDVGAGCIRHDKNHVPRSEPGSSGGSKIQKLAEQMFSTKEEWRAVGWHRSGKGAPPRRDGEARDKRKVWEEREGAYAYLLRLGFRGVSVMSSG